MAKKKIKLETVFLGTPDPELLPESIWWTLFDQLINENQSSQNDFGHASIFRTKNSHFASDVSSMSMP